MSSSVSSKAVQSVATRIPKVISARAHGFIDYAHAAFFFTLGVACLKKKNRAGGLAALGTGAFVLVESLLTDYPLGAKRVMPFATHGKLDAGFAAASFLMPTLCGFSGTKAAVVFRVNGFVESTVVALTDFNSERAHEAAEEPSGVLPADVKSALEGSKASLKEKLNDIAEKRIEMAKQ